MSKSGDMGVQPFAYNVSASTVGVNKTIYWYPTNNKSGFKSGKNVAVKISLKTSGSADNDLDRWGKLKGTVPPAGAKRNGAGEKAGRTDGGIYRYDGRKYSKKPFDYR